MANTLVMEQHFERDKNLKASGITVLVCGLIFLLFFLVNWTVPVVPKPEVLEGIEVNIGNSDAGSGSVQPLVQGGPGPTSNPDNTPQPAAGGKPSTDEKTDVEKDPDGIPSTSKPAIKNPNPNPTPAKKAEPKPPAPPTPKAKMNSKYGGGKENGGNNPDSYNKSKDQGDDPNGTKGDKGKPNGTPDGKGYTGNGGNGPSVYRGDRKIINNPSYATNVQPATIYAIVNVSADGIGTFVEIDLRLSSANSSAYKTEIINYLRKMKFNKSDHESTVTIKVIFKR